jgi:hypothetical protein
MLINEVWECFSAEQYRMELRQKLKTKTFMSERLGYLWPLSQKWRGASSRGIEYWLRSRSQVQEIDSPNHSLCCPFNRPYRHNLLSMGKNSTLGAFPYRFLSALEIISHGSLPVANVSGMNCRCLPDEHKCNEWAFVTAQAVNVTLCTVAPLYIHISRAKVAPRQINGTMPLATVQTTTKEFVEAANSIPNQ